ncbi:hypothetical protein WAX74_00750 [Psychrobacillus sp. FJAT-51614]|uniref:Uncharacterized protein n=1 Tax=Psychrobacillus mangrovi TaxID=3117745 RepID=A0ABU8EZK3_9BACI
MKNISTCCGAKPQTEQAEPTNLLGSLPIAIIGAGPVGLAADMVGSCCTTY